MNAVRDALTRGTARLAAAGVDTPRLDARVLLAYAMEAATEDLLATREMTPEQLARFEAAIVRREAREPLAYIVGHKEFWSIDFEVGPGALVPRPETETLIEEALRDHPDRSAPLDVADFGTGSGCLLVAFLTNFPNATGLGIDRSAEALAWARRNVARHGLEARCVLSQADWVEGVDGSFDVLFSNPPYVSEAEAADAWPEMGHEPQAALVGGPDGLDAYRALAPLIAGCLRPAGRAYLEIGTSRAEAVQSVLEREGVKIVRMVRDLAGHPRCLVAAMAKKQLETP
ncbi:MAG: peptide chain release factor N(5)-glutamine methyltransferase [Rhizomicrobium sp.]|jgi:release factor glutamine methyltransferase